MMRKGFKLYEEEGNGYTPYSYVVNNRDLCDLDNDSIQQYMDDDVDPRLSMDSDIIKHINVFEFDELSNYIYNKELIDQNRVPTTDRIVIGGRPFLIKAWLSEVGEDGYIYFYKGYIHLKDIESGCVWSFVDRYVMSKYFEMWEESMLELKLGLVDSCLPTEDYYANLEDFEC